MCNLFKIRRQTKNVFIKNSWSFGGGWSTNATFIDLLFFGFKVRCLHKYYIAYNGRFCDLRDVNYNIK